MIQKSIAARAAGCALALLFASDVGAVDIESLAPQGSTLVIYDTGQGLVSEQRRLTLARGENQIRFLGIPARMDAASASLSASSGGAAIQVLDQRFEYDLTGVRQLLKRYQGQAIAVDDGASVQKGKLLALPQEPDSSLALLDAGGAARVFPDARRLQAVEFPRAAEQAYLTPALVVRATTPQEGLQSLRLNYLVEGLSWEASYEAVRSGAGGMIYLGIRAGLKNLSGARFESARIKLAATEKGGFFDPSAESSVRAGGA